MHPHRNDGRRRCRAPNGALLFAAATSVAVIVAAAAAAPSAAAFRPAAAPGRAGARLSRPRAAATSSGVGDDSSDGRVPFVVDRVEKGTQRLMEGVSQMCINVFFNEDDGVAAPWKTLQLAYLRNMQYSELRFTTMGSGKVYDMYVAREVLPITSETFVLDDDDVILDNGDISNADCLPQINGDVDGYARGRVLGFVEVAEKRFGLGVEYDGTDEDESESSSPSSDTSSKVKLGKRGGIGADGNTVRPFLTNLAVVKEARKSGVGSALLSACESAVLEWDGGYSEIVLQVEDDNPSARKFYEKRGYKALFSDPASRRYDTSGFVLKKVPTTKVAMRKVLGGRLDIVGNKKETRFDPTFFFAKIREAVLS